MYYSHQECITVISNVLQTSAMYYGNPHRRGEGGEGEERYAGESGRDRENEERDGEIGKTERREREVENE